MPHFFHLCDGQTNGRTDRLIDRQTSGRMNRQTDLRDSRRYQTPSYRVIYKTNRFYPQREVRVDGRTNWWTDGRTNGQAHRQSVGHRDEPGRTEGPSWIERATHIDDSMDLFDQFQSFSSRDAVDNRFQRTLDLLTGISMGQLNSCALELLTYRPNPTYFISS